MTLRGLDASAMQGGVLPFALFPADYRFVILKCAQGNDGIDPSFARNVKLATAKGLVVFAYCFVYPLPHLDPLVQAKTFVDAVRAGGVEGPIFLDCEWPAPQRLHPQEKGWAEWGCSATQIATWLEAHCAEVARLSGCQPVLYTYPDWWTNLARGADVSWAVEYDLWIASYVTKGWPRDTDAPTVPRPWRTWRFWQFDGNGGLRLPNGVDADFCIFNGSESELQAFAQGEPISAPPVNVNTVVGLQAALADAGFFNGALDGVRGPQTVAAIMAFQLARGLAPDGIVGPDTRAALTPS